MLLFQGKRGFQKQPFQLPDFIAATGIEKIRQVTYFLGVEEHIWSVCVGFSEATIRVYWLIGW